MSKADQTTKAKPRRVLMTTSVFPRWTGDDTPPFVLRQAEAVADAGWEVTVLAPHCHGAAWNEPWGKVKVIRFPYVWPHRWQGLFYEGGMLVQLRNHPQRKWQLPLMMLAQIHATRKLCDTKQYDLVHSHSLLPQGLTALYNGCLPVVATSHGNDVFGLKEGGLYGKLKRRVVSGVDALTANSSATESALIRLGAPPERIHRVPASPNVGKPSADGVARLRSHYAGAPLILFSGRLIEEKGVADLISAFAKLADDAGRLVIIGEGADRSKFEAQAAQLGVAQRIEFAGWRSREELANYMAVADMFVGPSKPLNGWVEAQGLVFAEAMAAGLPVVATRCGGIPDMIIDGETGLLVEPGDVDALASAMTRILCDAKLRASCVAQARSRYDAEFSPEVVTQKLLGVYDRVMRNFEGEKE